MGLSITVLGSSGVYAGEDLACSGFLVRTPGATVMMDAGPGTLANLQRHVAPDELDAVLLSHSHPDHWLEFPVLRNALKYVLARPSPVDLYATAETLGLAEMLCGGGLAPTFTPHVISDGAELSVSDLDVRCSRTDHPVETLAFGLASQGRTAAYTADTGPAWSVGELGRELDLVISEATFVDGDADASPVHLSAAQAGSLARSAGARRLAITHVLPAGSVDAALAEAADAYGAPVEHATMHRCLDV